MRKGGEEEDDWERRDEKEPSGKGDGDMARKMKSNNGRGGETISLTQGESS